MPKFAYGARSKATALSTAALTVAALTSCDTQDGAGPEGTPQVVTTFSVLADMTAEIGGDRIEVQSITPVGAEVHEYDPTPADIQAVTDADLVIENGLNLEEWFEQFIAHSEAPVVTASEGIDVQEVTHLPDHPDGAQGLPEDPHGWISPVQAITYIDNIEAGLAELSPEDAEYFAERADEYRQQLTELAEEAQGRAAELEADYLVTCEGAFGYLAQDLGLTEHYLWPLNAENEGTPQQVEAQIDFVEDNGVETIFCESTVNDAAQAQVAESTGAELAGPLYVDSLTDGGDAETYLELLEYTIDTILSSHE